MQNMLFALIAAVAVLTGSISDAADRRNVTIVNGTGYGIRFLGVNPPGDEDWSENEISRVLADRGSVYVKFNTADKGCRWNILITWEDEDSSVRWRNVDLCSITTLTLKYDEDTEETSFSAR